MSITKTTCDVCGEMKPRLQLKYRAIKSTFTKAYVDKTLYEVCDDCFWKLRSQIRKAKK